MKKKTGNSTRNGSRKLPAVNHDPRDPLMINSRLYRQCGELLSRLESEQNLLLRDHIAAVLAVGRLQTIFMGLRREKGNSSEAGAKVRQYAAAFGAPQPNEKDSNEPEPEERLEDDIIEDVLSDYAGEDDQKHDEPEH